jgi:hypothetical protein
VPISENARQKTPLLASIVIKNGNKVVFFTALSNTVRMTAGEWETGGFSNAKLRLALFVCATAKARRSGPLPFLSPSLSKSESLTLFVRTGP